MLVTLATILFVIVCLLLVFIIFVQRGKSSMGLGSMGGSTQMLFGGSGGQDLFQKVTWVLAAIYMLGSLSLAKLTTQSFNQSRYFTKTRTIQTPVTQTTQESTTPSEASPAQEAPTPDNA